MEKKIKILLGFDGSDNAIEAVKYAASFFPPHKTEVILFYVTTRFPESFFQKGGKGGFQISQPEIRACMTDEYRKTNDAFKKADAIFNDAGFPSDSVIRKIQEKQIGKALDIIKESREGYDAVIVGRTGNSKIRDILIGSIATKLLDRIKPIPLIVVGGSPCNKKILVAFDGSREIMNALAHVGCLVDTCSCNVLLCHVLHLHRKFQQNEEPQSQTEEQKHMEPLITQAVAKLTDAGFPLDQILKEVITDKISRATGIIETAKDGGYGTVIVGRRGLSYINEFFLGRVGQKIFDLAGDLTVWVVR